MCSTRFWKCSHGAAAVEFAVVAPVFFLLVMGIIEIGLYMYTSVALESMVSRVGREASIGNIPGVGTRSERALAMIRNDTSALMGGNMTVISSRVIVADQQGGFDGRPEPDVCLDAGIANPIGAPQCNSFQDNNGNGVYDSSTGSSDFGASEDVVEITVRLPWRANIGLVRDIWGPDGLAVITASTVVKNEPEFGGN